MAVFSHFLPNMRVNFLFSYSKEDIAIALPIIMYDGS